jgi:P pilus assembly chaperone PapD
MNRWVWPVAVIAALGAVTTAASFVGPQPVPQTPFASSASRVSVVCPAFESVTATVRVAVAAIGKGLRTSKVTEPNQGTDAGAFKVLTNTGQPLRVSAPLPDPFGATSVVVAENGPDRGLSASGCVVPRTEHWFTGVDVRTEAQSEVVVSNLDGTSASVDLTAYGEDGKVAAPRGVEVAGNSSATISLGVLPRLGGPVTVRVGSSDGRVAAFVRQRTWQADVPLGVDWLPSGTDPSTDLVVPGIPEGGGARKLVLTNPGERTATVTIGVLGTSGPIELAGAEQLEVPAGTTRMIDLAAGLAEQSAALKLTSTQPVTAGMWLDSGGDDARRDPAYTVATAPLPVDAIWPLAVGKSGRTVLQLANPGEAAASVSVTTSANAEAPGSPTVVEVPPGSTISVPIDPAAANVVRVQTAATDVRAALVSTERLGKVRGLSVVDLAAQDAHDASAQVVFDPHAGS